MLPFCAEALLLLAAAGLQNNAEAQLSTVKTPDLPVYSQTSVESPAVKTLHQGDRVFVEFEIFSGEAWCWIREMDRAKSSGYVFCAQLDRPQQAAEKWWRLSSPQSAGAAAGGTPAKKSDTDRPAAETNPARSMLESSTLENYQERQREATQKCVNEHNACIAACDALPPPPMINRAKPACREVCDIGKEKCMLPVNMSSPPADILPRRIPIKGPAPKM